MYLFGFPIVRQTLFVEESPVGGATPSFGFVAFRHLMRPLAFRRVLHVSLSAKGKDTTQYVLDV